MNLKNSSRRWLIAISCVCMAIPTTAMLVGGRLNQPMKVVDSEGRYFVQDFESDVPLTQSEVAEEVSVVVEGQGEWLYKNAFASTNSSYVVSGKQNLRLAKSGSYVVTPVLEKGVKTITFIAKRNNSGLEVSVSADGGKSWTVQESLASGTGDKTITVENLEVNRLRIANNTGKDADIDDLVVTAQAYGTEAQVTTGGATNITKNTADLSGTLIDGGDQPLKDLGIVWATRENPTVGDFKESTDNLKATDFTISADRLKASTTYYYRAFAVSNAGTVYGENKTFTTEAATPAVVTTKDITRSINKYVSGGQVIDDGGADLLEVGVILGESAGLNMENATKIAANTPKSVFTITLPVEQGRTYYVRAYATTTVGTSLGDEKSITIDENTPTTPDVSERIWCAPDGDDTTADGTEAKPFYSLDNAIAIVEPGQTICMKAGTYVYDHRININDRNGEPEAYIKLMCPDGRATLDFSAMPQHGHSDNPYQGVRLTSSYWHFYRIDICNASDNGLLIERNKPTGGSSSDIANLTDQAHDNIIEQCNFYKNGDTGLQIKNLGAQNYIINCDSYLNCDEGQGDADGFAPKLSVGDGNYFYGCRAYLNSDDGWDVFYKKDGAFGDNMTIIMDNCISYKNGFLDENTIADSGNGNGFKCGSDQGAMNVYLNRCLAIHNKAKGFDQNHNAGDIIMNNCTGMTLKSLCGEKSYSYRIYEAIASGHEVRLTNCIAINDNDATDKRDKNTGLPKEGENGKQGLYGRFEVDETLDGMTATTCEFHRAAPDLFIDVTNDATLIAPRNDDGSLPATTFAHIKEGASHKYYDGTTKTAEDILIGKGTPITETEYRGFNLSDIRSRFDVPTTTDAPSLGAYEVTDPTAIGRILSVDSSSKAVRLVQCQNGMVVIGVNGAKATDAFLLTATDASGKILGCYQFNATGSIFLPAVHGIVLLKVTGRNVNETLKVTL